MSNILDHERFRLMVQLRTVVGMVAIRDETPSWERIAQTDKTIDAVDDFIKRLLYEEQVD